MLSNELKEALDDPGFIAALTDSELAMFIEEHPEIMDLVLEDGLSPNDAVDYLGELKVPKPSDIKGKGSWRDNFKPGNPGNDPFKTQPLHKTDSAGKGGGSKKGNPRSRTGECKNCKCSNYVCNCTCNGAKRKIDMTAYKSRKKDYMDHWRRSHGPKHPR